MRPTLVLATAFYTLSTCTQALGISTRFDTVLVDLAHVPHPVFSVEAGSDSTIYAISSKGILKWDGRTFQEVIAGYSGPIAFERSGNTEWPVETYCSDEDRFEPYAEWSRLFNQESHRTTVATASDGKFWVCDGSRVYVYALIPKLKQYAKGMSTRGVTRWRDDMWINTYGGLYRNNEPFAEVQSARSGPALVCRDTLYSLGERAIIVHGNPIQADSLDIGTKKGSLFSLAVHRDSLWACANQSVGVIGSSGFEPKHHFGVDLNLVNVERELWALPLESKGAFRLIDGAFESITFCDAQINDVIRCDEGYFFATDSGIVLWNEDRNSISVKGIAEGLPSNFICGLYLSPSGELWASTYGGLCRMNWEFGWMETHLPLTEFNCHSKFIPSNQAGCYFGSMDGLFFLDPLQFRPLQEPPSTLTDARLDRALIAFTLLLLAFLAMAILWGHRSARNNAMTQKIIEELYERNRLMENQNFRQQLENIMHSQLPGTSIDSCAEAMGMTSRHLLNVCQEKLGVRPSEILKDLKLNIAKKELATNPDQDLNAIATRIGYSSRYLKELLKRNV